MKLIKLIVLVLFLLLYYAIQSTAQTCAWLIDPALQEIYEGHYEFHQKRILYIQQEEGMFRGQMTGFSELPLTPTGHHEFYFTDIGAKVTFQTDASGQTTGLNFTLDDLQHAQKIDLDHKPLKNKVLKRYKGTYKLSEESSIEVFSKNGELFALHNEQEMRLIPLRKHLFYSPSSVMKIGFNPDFDDSIKSLTMYVGQGREALKL